MRQPSWLLSGLLLTLDGADGVSLLSRGGPWPTGQKETETVWAEVGKHCYAGKGGEDALLSTGAVEAANIADVAACKALCTGACESITYSLTGSKVCRGVKNVVDANCEASSDFATHKGTKVLTAAAKAMVEAIAQEQESLSSRLVADESDVKAATQRLRHAINTATQVETVFSKIEAGAGKVKSMASTNNQTMVNLKANREVLRASVVVALETVKKLNESKIKDVQEDLKAVNKLVQVDKRATENLRILKMMKPRLQRMESDVDVIEQDQRWGNLTRVINNKVFNDINTVAEDVGRGLAKQLPEKAFI